ncbi:MAG: 50S ribosomal protein L6 [Rhodospirillaceae bacterium]|nr:50S ribosomal protein L6 [Rhodospirillaceae bacterium]HAA90827.1 50S ribosomal protein L6 [Rhodospirillaceae bacterium]|tara:strand:+ start:181 stop:720 length:540 start_codon:yes stop_codon:yes gene_type:complete
MSRVGKNPVAIPDGVDVSIAGRVLTAKGKLGELTVPLHDAVTVELEDGSVTVQPNDQSKQSRSLWGTTRSLVDNAVAGVSEGFTKKLEINGVGYRAQLKGKVLNLQLGYSHDIEFPIPEGISIALEGDRDSVISVSGANKQLVGEVASKIRGFRKPEPYKGKGIKYVGEYILRKEGKKK